MTQPLHQPHRSRPLNAAKLSVAPIAIFVCSHVFAPAVRSQNDAFWNGGSGNWSNASQWSCDIVGNPNNPVPCVPNGNFNVGIGAGGDTINVDVNVNVISAGLGSDNLTMNGTSLITSQGLDAGGVQATGATITGPSVGFSGPSSSSSSTVSATSDLGLANFNPLQLSNSTIIFPGKQSSKPLDHRHALSQQHDAFAFRHGC